MTNSFKDLLAHDVEAVFLDTSAFAESVTYLPVSGGPRTIAAVVDEEGQFRDDDQAQQVVEAIRVFAARDASTGIDAPRLGDQLRLADGRTFKWSGETSDADSAAWALHFRRVAPLREGTSQVQHG